MRVECESCGELVAASFTRHGDAVRATCPACTHAMVVALAPATSGASAPEAITEPGAPDAEPGAELERSANRGAGAGDRAPRDGRCPKCGATRRGAAAACPSCGLAAARMASYTSARDAAVPEAVHRAWSRALAAWDDPARHEEVLQQVAAHSCYAWAAGRYRTRGRDPIAARQLDRLRRAAEATLLAGASVRRETNQPYRMSRGVLGFLIVMIVAGLLYATARRPVRAPSPPPVPAPLVPGHPANPSSVR